MASKKNLGLSLFEIVRHHLEWENWEMAAAFDQPRQWAWKKRNPNGLLLIRDIAKLYDLSGMTPEEFLTAIKQAAAAAEKAAKD